MDLSLAQLQFLVDQFDLGRITRMDKPIDTQCNTTEPFKTGRGTFMLRARHGDEFAERVEYIHEVMDTLRANDFPVPEVMKTPEGNGCIVWGERIVEVHRFIPHDTGVHRDWARMFAAAGTLADMHGILAHSKLERPPVPPELRNDVGPEHILGFLEEGETMLLELAEQREDARRALDVIREARDAVMPMVEGYDQKIGSLPWLTVHGDYHFWNLLYRGDEVAGVVDYDFLQERERLFDLAYSLQSLITYLSATHRKQLFDFAELRWDNVITWIEYYNDATHLPLTREERLWLPTELLRIFLVNICTALSAPNPVEQINSHLFELRLYRWVYAQKELFL
jgi:homoserine kinase type II